MSNEFVTSKLQNIASVQTGPFGSQLHQRDYVDIGTPIITVEHLGDNRIIHENLPCVSDEDRDRLSKYQLLEGDIVFSRVGSVDRCAYVKKEEEGWLFSGRCLRIRSDPQLVSSKYLSFYFGHPSFKTYIRQIAVGATMPSLNTSLMGELEIPLPPLQTQKKIASILSSLDDKIEINTRMNKVLEEIARALFHRWFVEFEFPDVEGRPYKSSGGKMVESEMGLVPEGWEIHRADDVFDISIGKTPPRKESKWFSLEKSDVKWVSISDMGASGMYIFKTSEYLTQEAVEKFRVKVVPKNTIVLSFKLTVGRVAITSKDMVTNEAIACFKTDEPALTSYLYFYLKNYDYGSLGSTSSIATAVNSKIIKSMPILIPEPKILMKYHNIILQLIQQIKSNQKECFTLSELRDILLPKLMNGEIKFEY